MAGTLVQVVFKVEIKRGNPAGLLKLTSNMKTKVTKLATPKFFFQLYDLYDTQLWNQGAHFAT